MTNNTPAIILASGSFYRKQQLAQLRLPFTVDTPNIDESPKLNESPSSLAKRLAQDKAHKVSLRHPLACVIGADQVADLNGQRLGKPLTTTRAIEQLTQFSGQTVLFHSAICTFANGQRLSDNVVTQVTFRTLSTAEIESYVTREQPLDCAGSFKCEGLGIALFERIVSEDPSALIGLPLISLTSQLKKAGIFVL